MGLQLKRCVLHLLNSRHKLPIQRVAHLLPHHVLLQLLLSVLHHRNVRQILRLVQQYAQLKQRVSAIEEIRPVNRAVNCPRLLNLNKQDAQSVLQFVAHYRRLYSKDRVNILNVLEVPIESEFLQNLAHLLVIDLVHQVLDPLLLNATSNRLDDMGRDLRRLLRLKLRQNLLEMIQTHVGIVSDLVRRLFVNRLLVVHNILDVGTALLVVANHDALVFLGD